MSKETKKKMKKMKKQSLEGYDMILEMKWRKCLYGWFEKSDISVGR